jgi:D-alanyl-D-alanine dipeptidase
LHNFGAAIDLTLAYKKDGEALDMGTPYDFFGIEAYPIKEPLMLEKNRITQEAVDNRKLLRRCMMEGGFFNIQTEWWHFNSCYREEAIELYEIVE